MKQASRNVFHSFTVETKTLGLNPRITEHGKLYDKLIAMGTFFVDPVPVVGIDNARFTVKSPTGERKRVHTIDAAGKAIEAWVLEHAAAMPTLKASDSALVTWRVKNYAI